MKIIGDAGNQKYLVEISHTEIEKVVGKYYGNLKKLVVGEFVDIAAGYDFTNDIKHVCEAMTAASKAFEGRQKTLLEFAAMIAAQGERNGN